jgi:uracil-DNA glycosylase family 4
VSGRRVILGRAQSLKRSTPTFHMPDFDSNCTRCPRLAGFLKDVKQKHPSYYAKPVPPFGDPEARLLIVGLAPGMHGANATGRPFTGDYAGILLYQTLHKFGFASAPESTSLDDGLQLINCRITNAVKCLPPENKPVGEEINTCNEYLAGELHSMGGASLVLALGTIAHKAVLRGLGLKQSQFKFAHGAVHKPNDKLTLIDSYHCSRYNTQTRRLTPAMFESVFQQASDLLAR